MSKDAFWDADDPEDGVSSSGVPRDLDPIPNPSSTRVTVNGLSSANPSESDALQQQKSKSTRSRTVATWESIGFEIHQSHDARADPECFQHSKPCPGYWQTYEARHRTDQQLPHKQRAHEQPSPPIYANKCGSDVLKLPSLSGWQLKPRIVFSRNKHTESSKFLRPENLISLPELIPRSDKLEHALLTSFAPWEPSFLIKHVPLSAAVTFISSVHKGLIFGEPESREPDEDTKWICLEHEDRTCSWCDEWIMPGSSYYECAQCDFPICEVCLPEVNPQAFREYFDDDDDCEHDPVAHYLEPKTLIAADACKCTSKRPVHWISPKLATNDGPTSKYSIFHAKLMLLLYDTHLRVVISSFNTSEKVFNKWTDSFWICDLKRLEPGGPTVGESNHSFFGELVHFIRMTGAEEWAARVETLNLDLSALTKGFVLISSIPHEVCTSETPITTCSQDSRVSNSQAKISYAHSAHLHGLNALHRALADFGSPSGAISGPAFVGAFSIGGSGFPWLRSFAAALGSSLSPAELRVISDESCSYFDPQLALRACGCLWRADIDLHSHSKQLLRVWTHPSCSKLHGWTYVGSHNLSKASWGSIEIPSDMNLWELGVLSHSSCSLVTEDHHRLSSASSSCSEIQTSTATCCDGWSLSEVPFLYDVSKAEPLSWYHDLTVRSFTKLLVAHSFMRVIGSKSRDGTFAPAGLVFVVGNIALLGSFDIALSQAVWPSSLPFPPSNDTVFLGQFRLDEKRVVWVERVFHKNATGPLEASKSVATVTNHTSNHNLSRFGGRGASRDGRYERPREYQRGAHQMNQLDRDHARPTPSSLSSEASISSSTSCSSSNPGKSIPPQLRNGGGARQQNSRTSGYGRHQRHF